MSSTVDTPTDITTDRMVGQVKWFNNKAGYGFITVSEGEYSNKDIFIHYSSIRVANSQYKYLIQGEYVEFTLTKSNTDGHEFQANDISGIKGGSLMCETRRTNRQVGDSMDAAPAQVARPAVRRYRTPRDNVKSAPDSGDGFSQVVRRRPAGSRRPPPSSPLVAV